MSQPLPTRDLEWLQRDEISEMMGDHSEIRSCTVEVDIEYPNHLNDLHDEYPLAPELVTVNGVKKLIPNQNHKKNYVTHHRALQQQLYLWVKLTKIHSGIKYTETKILEEYIRFNTESRKNAKNEFEKDFWKLVINSLFGKTMENV